MHQVRVIVCVRVESSKFLGSFCGIFGVLVLWIIKGLGELGVKRWSLS